MITLRECTRQTTCYDCDSKICNGAGDKGADCPKYHCDNPLGIGNCDECRFIDVFIEKMRKQYDTV